MSTFRMIFFLFAVLVLTPAVAYGAEGLDDTTSHGSASNGNEYAAATDDLLLFFDESDLIVSATMHPLSIKKAPAIATVFSAKDLRNMGARDVIDVLKRVPGFSVTKSRIGFELVEVRGLRSARSEKIKLLIDGHSANNNIDGGIVWSFDSLSVDNVKRIEVIRGPGSALYGSNAFSGIVSVVTKDGADIDGVIVSAGGGSFDTQKINLQAGKAFGDFDLALMLDYFTTDGDNLIIKKDAFGNSGDTLDFEDKFEGQLKLKYKDFGLNARFLEREKGPYLGVGSAINDETVIDSKQFFMDLTYSTAFMDGALPVAVRAYMDRFDWQAHWELFNEGVVPGFPLGAEGVPSFKERTVGAELQTDYNISKDNLLTVGALVENRRQYDLRVTGNLDLCSGAPLPSYPAFTDTTDTCNWNLNEDRDIWALYFQDVWDVHEDLALTLGVRHDDYSDFGSTTNPRLAVVWGFARDWDLKLLYATAFRAPTFIELYNENNPAELGNPNLDPEEMRTWEVSLAHTYRENTTVRATYFNNTISERIQSKPTATPGLFMFENTGKACVWGVEVEAKRKFNGGSSIYANYTYQNTEDRDMGRELSNVAKHMGNVGADIAVTEKFNANVNVLMMGEKQRAAGDARGALAGHTVVDLTLIAKGFIDKGLEFRLSGHNIFDEKYEDPAPATTLSDFPRQGTSVLAEASYRF